MEIDFSELELKGDAAVWVIAGMLVLGFLGALGRFALPDRVLTWTEWKVLKQHVEYGREVAMMERYTDRLAAILDDTPDPVRAQLAVEQLYADMGRHVTLDALGAPREALLTAGDVTLEWALGSVEKEDADLALEVARKAIDTAAERAHEQR